MKSLRQKLLILVLLFMTGTSLPQNNSQAEQQKFIIFEDGRITVEGQSFNNFSEYFKSDYFKQTGRRCLVKWRTPETRAAALLKQSDCSLSRTIIKDEYWPRQTWIIPVVVHNITNNSNRGYLSDQRIHDQITVLNEDFGAITGTMGELGFDTKIQFELVQIDRVKNDTWFNDNDEIGYKRTLGWDQNKYLNIYTNTASGYLGYSYMPQEDSGDVYDGVVILYEAVGGRNNGYDVYDQGRTLVHEIGHYLGLLHTFEGYGCYTGYNQGDFINDTLPEDDEHYSCVETNSCGDPDNIHNYMNYTDDKCMSEFTPEQGNRMICSVFNYRPQLAYIANQAPQITSTPLLECLVEQLYEYQVIVQDAENDTITFSLTSGPAGMIISANDGLVTWTPTLADVGTHSISIVAADRYGEDVQSFSLTVSNPNPAPVAMFDADTTSGYIPFTVNFTDLSTGNITNWRWNFGDSTISNLQNPQHIYNHAGDFSVTLKVTGAGGSDSLTIQDYIHTVDNSVTAGFGAFPLSGIAPLQVQFSDSSRGEITARLWDFGDASFSTVINPLHIYQAPGEYTVRLVVTGAADSDTLNKAGYITVWDETPIANFGAEPTNGEWPLLVQFADSSQGSIENWLWNFGDSTMSAQRNPEHQYEHAGLYSVSLTVSGPGGADTLRKVDYIQVTERTPIANFGAAPVAGQAPLTVQFADSSRGVITAWLWDFGDSTMSTQRNPEHQYEHTGLYSVSLTVSGPGGADTLRKVDYIQVTEKTPIANFGAAPVAGRAPLTVQFADSSRGVISAWLWNFGDSTMSTQRNPEHQYQHTGLYSVSLTVSGPGGANTLHKLDFIQVLEQPPLAYFTAEPVAGRAPLTVQFADSSSGVITAWLWDFGDSTTSTNKNPVHEYTSVGLFTVTLQVTGPGGAHFFSRSDYIDVQNPLAIDQAKQLPEKFVLKQNYPNPFNLTTTIHYQLPEKSEVWLAIYDMNGKITRILENASRDAGEYQVLWDGRDANGQVAASGIYITRIKCARFQDNIKIILLK